MSSASPANAAVVELDQLFLDIFRDLLNDTVRCASEAARQILNMSGEFLNENAQHALRDFHSLYFSGSTELDSQKDKVNADIDSMFATIAANLQQGASTEEIHKLIVEDAETKKARLALSGLQKQLEGIVAFDQGIRERLVPVLNTMQIEDQIVQRITHIIRSWEAVTERLKSGNSFNTAELAGELAAMLTSQHEQKSYYKIVLQQDILDGPSDEKLWFAS